MIPPAMHYGVHVSGSYAYMADARSGLHVIDASDLSNPYEVGFYDTPGSAQGVHVSGSYAYVADLNEGLRVIDISDPSNPYEVGFYDTPGSATGVHVSGSYAYVADGGKYLWEESQQALTFKNRKQFTGTAKTTEANG